MRRSPVRGKASRRLTRRSSAKRRPVRPRLLSALFLAFVLLCGWLLADSIMRGRHTVEKWSDLADLAFGTLFLLALLCFALTATLTTNAIGKRWAEGFGLAGLFILAATFILAAAFMLVDPWSSIGHGGKANFDTPGEVRFFGVAWGSVGFILLLVSVGLLHTRRPKGQEDPRSDDPSR